MLVDIRLGDESGFDFAQRLRGTVILISTDAGLTPMVPSWSEMVVRLVRVELG